MARMMSEDFIGTCQWCFGEYKVNNRRGMVLHGYTRPGYGHTVGNCRGVGHPPFQDAHDLTEVRITELREDNAKLAKQIKMIDSGKITKLRNPHYVSEADRKPRGYYSDEQSIEFFTTEHERFPRLLSNMRANLEGEIRFNEGIITYLETMVANWAKGSIVGLDSPPTGRERYIRDAYDPDKEKAAEDLAAKRAERDAKPGKIAINFYEQIPFPNRNAGLTDDAWRAAIEQVHADEKAFKERVKAWAKATFPGKLWVGDGDSGEFRAMGLKEYGEDYRTECVAVRPEWQYLEQVMKMFPEHHRFDKDTNRRDPMTKQGIGKGKDIRIWVDASKIV